MPGVPHHKNGCGIRGDEYRVTGLEETNRPAGTGLLSGAVKEWPSPSGPKSEPYGMVFTKGAVWYNESNAKPNAIVRFDLRR